MKRFHFIALAALLPLTASAQIINDTRFPCIKTGSCSLIDMVAVVGYFIQWAISLSGAVALIAFVIGGVYMMASAGREDWVTRGKSILTSSVIALFYIFGAYVLVNTILTNILPVGPEYRLENRLEEVTTSSSACTAELEGKPCPGKSYMQCLNQVCVNLCEFEHQFQVGWGCNSLFNCGLASADQCGSRPNTCAADTASKKYCADQPNTFCCLRTMH